jgi:hypothetical protein
MLIRQRKCSGTWLQKSTDLMSSSKGFEQNFEPVHYPQLSDGGIVQAIPSTIELQFFCDQFGKRLVVGANYIVWLIKLSTTRARLLIGDVVKMEPYATHVREENYGFLRTQAVFKKCMESAHNCWGWVQCKLR